MIFSRRGLGGGAFSQKAEPVRRIGLVPHEKRVEGLERHQRPAAPERLVLHELAELRPIPPPTAIARHEAADCLHRPCLPVGDLDAQRIENLVPQEALDRSPRGPQLPLQDFAESLEAHRPVVEPRPRRRDEPHTQWRRELVPRRVDNIAARIEPAGLRKQRGRW